MKFHLSRALLFGLALTATAVLPQPAKSQNTGVADSSSSSAQSTAASGSPSSPGAVFVLTNKASENEVIAFNRAPNGILTQTGRYPTGGNGIGTDFDTQGGLVVSV